MHQMNCGVFSLPAATSSGGSWMVHTLRGGSINHLKWVVLVEIITHWVYPITNEDDG